MTDNSPASVDVPQRFTFSLRTMFLIVTCAAFFSLGFRVAGPDGFRVILGLLFTAIFLRIWFWKRSRERSHIPQLLVLLGLAFFVDLPTLVESAQEAARGLQCENNLKLIGQALKSYHQKYGSFPAAYSTDAKGTPLTSWRAAILPFLEEEALYKSLRLDQPWNGPNNGSFALQPLFIYRCAGGKEQPSSRTSYVAIVGPNTGWLGSTARKLADFKNPSETILVIEVPNSGINWLEPRDLTVEQLKQGLGPLLSAGGESPHSGGFNALFADGHVETIPADIDPQRLARMLEINPADETGK